VAQVTTLRLQAGVTQVRRPGGQLLLLPPGAGTPLRLTGVGGELVPLLERGATLGQLEAHLVHLHPGARDVGPKVSRFLATLGAAGLLDGTTPATTAPRRREPRRILLGNPDRLARALAKAFVAVPGWARRIAGAAMAAAAVAGVTLALASPHRPTLGDYAFGIDAVALLLLFVVVVPLHELAHAVACRAAGAPVSGAGIMFHRLIVPAPYIDTREAYRIAERGRRFWIPFAGPYVDLLAAGAAGWALVAGGGGATASYLLLLCLAILIFDTNPLRPSDGSHMIETIFDDELLRQRALGRGGRGSPRAIRAYRTIAAAHLAVVAAYLVGMGV
jgi:putative peptide zinc metalloprotease protein